LRQLNNKMGGEAATSEGAENSMVCASAPPTGPDRFGEGVWPVENQEQQREPPGSQDSGPAGWSGRQLLTEDRNLPIAAPDFNRRARRLREHAAGLNQRAGIVGTGDDPHRSNAVVIQEIAIVFCRRHLALPTYSELQNLSVRCVNALIGTLSNKEGSDSKD
jgi:hypothetical protein